MIFYISFVVGAISAAFVFPLLCSVVKALLGIGPSGKIQVAPPIQEVIDAGGGEYRSEEHFAPKLTGKLFLWFSNFMWTPFGKEWVLSKLMRDNHLFDARERYLPEAATFYPTPPFIPFPEQGVREDGKSEKDEIDTLIGCVPSRSKDSSAETDEFVFPSILDYLHAYRCGRVTPVIVAERIIESIRASDSLSPPLRAFVQWNETEIRKQAEESTRRYRDKDNIRPLEGIPVGVKEEYLASNYRLLNGLSFLPVCAQNLDRKRQDSEPVARLKNAGAVLIGITNMHEIGIGSSGSNVNKLHQTARNPYDMSRYPGGSSSGSGAAVASGLIPLALGTDGGGSIRIPSSLCGIVGLKPTFGRISCARMCPVGMTVVNAGPMCNSIQDAALAYLLLSGRDPEDVNTVQQGPVSLDQYLDHSPDLTGLKVGVYDTWFNHSDQEVRSGCRTALTWLQEAGAEIVEIKIPEISQSQNAHLVALLSELLAAYRYDFPEHFKAFNRESILGLSLGTTLSAADYVVAGRQRTRAIKVYDHLFKRVDIIATPTTARTAPVIPQGADLYGESNLQNTLKIARYTIQSNLTGVPAICLPVSYDANNMPISLQLMSSWWKEDLLLHVASVVENRARKMKPKLYYDILNM
ncbi:Fatty acid amide hydrolase-like [Oopsacas minuta]|uniref:Fatty acid amide hydrolase-like n=1 Tax=Oopsacas minuta TaxID=111878 RepID=A0AAV7K0R5_9METZ|nr:Fatty acid amide hydrolase-like [Oopsacas minuta]